MTGAGRHQGSVQSVGTLKRVPGASCFEDAAALLSSPPSFPYLVTRSRSGHSVLPLSPGESAWSRGPPQSDQSLRASAHVAADAAEADANVAVAEAADAADAANSDAANAAVWIADADDDANWTIVQSRNVRRRIHGRSRTLASYSRRAPSQSALRSLSPLPLIPFSVPASPTGSEPGLRGPSLPVLSFTETGELN